MNVLEELKLETRVLEGAMSWISRLPYDGQVRVNTYLSDMISRNKTVVASLPTNGADTGGDHATVAVS